MSKLSYSHHISLSSPIQDVDMLLERTVTKQYRKNILFLKGSENGLIFVIKLFYICSAKMHDGFLHNINNIPSQF